MLAVCVLVAMPDVSAPVHRPVPDPKGKGMDPLEAQTPDPDPFMSSSSHRGARISDTALDEEGLPLLEFGVVEMRGHGEHEWHATGLYISSFINPHRSVCCYYFTFL